MAQENQTLAQPTRETTYMNIVAFIAFSFVVYSLLNVVYSATEDMLAGTTMPTSIVYMCQAVPCFLGSLLLPMIVHKITPLRTVLGTFCLEIAGILLLALSRSSEIKLIGVVLVSLAISLADCGFLSMSALYDEVTASAYPGASGIGIVFGSVYYTGMTTLLSVSMETTLLLLVWLPILIPVFYWLMDRKHIHTTSLSKTTTHQDIPYSPLKSSLLDHQFLPMTYRDKLKAVWDNMPLALPMFISTFVQFLLLQALITTLVFPNAPFPPHYHYQYYMFAAMVGQILGRASGFVILCLKCKIPDHTKHTWFFLLSIVGCMMFVIFAAWFRFLQNVLVVCSICFTIGLNTGIIFNCTFAAASRESCLRTRAFSRAFLVFPLCLGLVAASALGLYIEPKLIERCMYVSKYFKLCMTRMMRKGAGSL